MAKSERLERAVEESRIATHPKNQFRPLLCLGAAALIAAVGLLYLTATNTPIEEVPGRITNAITGPLTRKQYVVPPQNNTAITISTVPSASAPQQQVLTASEVLTTLDALRAKYATMPAKEVWDSVSLINSSVYTHMIGKPFPHTTRILDEQSYMVVVKKFVDAFGETARYLESSVGFTDITRNGIEILIKGELSDGRSKDPLYLLFLTIGETGHAEWERLAPNYTTVQPLITAHRFEEALSSAYNAAAIRQLESIGAINLDSPNTPEGKKAALENLEFMIAPTREDERHGAGWQILWASILTDPKLEMYRQKLFTTGKLTPKENLEVRNYLLTIPPNSVPNYVAALPPIETVKQQMEQILEKRLSSQNTLAEWEKTPTASNMFLP